MEKDNLGIPIIDCGSEAPWPAQTRSKAAQNGQSKYYTGTNCKYGHISQRYVSSGLCIACMSARSRQFRNDRAAAGRGLVPFNIMVHPADLTTITMLVENINKKRIA